MSFFVLSEVTVAETLLMFLLGDFFALYSPISYGMAALTRFLELPAAPFFLFDDILFGSGAMISFIVDDCGVLWCF